MAAIIVRDGARGRSYQVKWRDERGQQRSKTFKRKSDAQLFRAQVETGTHKLSVKPVTTIADALVRYTASRRASRSTLAKEASLSNRLKPLAGQPVESLRVSDVRAWVADLVDEGLAAETVSACLRLLRNVLDTAVEDDEVAANVAARVKPPRIVKPPLDADDVLSVPEFEAILRELPDRWRALFALRAYAGPRLSEALGMRRMDVDLLRRRVHVGHRVLEEVGGVVELRESGKTRGSDRWVPIPSRVLELLEHHMATYPSGRHELVFVGTDGAPVRRDNLRRRVWNPAVRTALVDDQPVTVVTMRNLRHTAASWMLAAGLDPLDVSFRLGHSKPSTTLDTYARFRPREHSETDPYDVALTNSGTTREHPSGERVVR
jgi:integrase